MGCGESDESDVGVDEAVELIDAFSGIPEEDEPTRPRKPEPELKGGGRASAWLEEPPTYGSTSSTPDSAQRDFVVVVVVVEF